MRRKDREITNFQEIIKIIDECEIIRLGLSNGNYPYIVPVNFAYQVVNNQIYIYIHGAMAGKKYEMLCNNPFCSFEMDIPLQIKCIVDKKNVTMKYKSIMGKAETSFLNGQEKQNAIDNIIMARHKETKNFKYDHNAIAHTAVVKLTVTEITAKANPIWKKAEP